jgi:hypothetical protein
MQAYLPPATQPWARRIERQHAPAQGRYPTFKNCLRWEFGFSCAFCLLHETDLLLSGIEGWSLMQIEHKVPQSKDKSQRHRYDNCFYICERCNKSRGTLPIQDDAGNALLDPCTVAWADHFVRIEDAILPRQDDGSAEYTWESYGLDDPPKVRLRERRRIWMERYAEALLNCAQLAATLVDKAVDEADKRAGSETAEKLASSQALHQVQTVLRDRLAEFAPIPESIDASCQCFRTDHLSLLGVLADQTVDLTTLLAQAKSRRKV